MPRCPSCRRTFRTLPDEEGMHDCPHCGHSPEDDYTRCAGCGIRIPDPGEDPDPDALLCDTCLREREEETEEERQPDAQDEYDRRADEEHDEIP